MVKKNTTSSVLLVLTTILLIVVLYFGYLKEAPLPIFNPADFHPELVDSSMLHTSEHRVRDFELRNQNGELVTQHDYENKIYITDFFFTRCPSICPIMSNNMEKLQRTFADDPKVMLLSISVTPELDSIPILKAYAQKHQAITAKWNITTGDKKHIYTLARKSYFAVVTEGDGGLQDFIHTPNFILIDTQKRIRGVYDGTKDEETERLIKDVKSLL